MSSAAHGCGPGVRQGRRSKSVSQGNFWDGTARRVDGAGARWRLLRRGRSPSNRTERRSRSTRSTRRSPSAAKADSADKIYVMRPIGKQAIPICKPVPRASSCARRVRWSTDCARQSRRPRTTCRCGSSRRASVLSTFHYINHGGSEFVVYRATPEDVESGVRVGDIEYPRLPGPGAGITAIRRCASRSSRCSSIRTANADCRCSRATRRATRRRAASTTRCSRSRTRRAASRSTTLPAARRAGHRQQLAGREDSRPTTCWRAS